MVTHSYTPQTLRRRVSPNWQVALQIHFFYWWNQAALQFWCLEKDLCNFSLWHSCEWEGLPPCWRLLLALTMLKLVEWLRSYLVSTTWVTSPSSNIRNRQTCNKDVSKKRTEALKTHVLLPPPGSLHWQEQSCTKHMVRFSSSVGLGQTWILDDPLESGTPMLSILLASN